MIAIESAAGPAARNAFGQYFTPEPIADFMVRLLPKNRASRVLEPCAGSGVFLDALAKAGYTNVDAIEIDVTCKPKTNSTVIYGDYLAPAVTGTYDAIIGNPPYIRWKNLPESTKASLKTNRIWKTYCSSLTDYSVAFIAKAVEDLSADGTLVYITQEYWLYTKHAQRVRDLLLAEGSVDRIYHFNEAKVFDGVSTSLVIFRFIKGQRGLPIDLYKLRTRLLHTTLLSEPSLNEHGSLFEHTRINSFAAGRRWSLEPEATRDELDRLETACTATHAPDRYVSLGSLCDIGNGMVSGLDAAFQLDSDAELNQRERDHSIVVAKAKHLNGRTVSETIRYIFLQERMTEQAFLRDFPNFAAHLGKYKDQLLQRYNYSRDIPYWEWVFLRNHNLFKASGPKIFVPCKERIGPKPAFRFTLSPAGIYPTQDVTALVPKATTCESIAYIQAFLQLPIVTTWIVNRGLMRGGVAEFSEAPLSAIAFRAIDWNSEKERTVHDEIAASWETYLLSGNTAERRNVQELFHRLLDRPGCV